MSPPSNVEAGYKRLLEDENEVQLPQFVEPSARLSFSGYINFSTFIHAGVIIVELLIASVLILGFIDLHKSPRLTTSGPMLDGLVALGDYNSTRVFSNHSHLLYGDSDEATGYWRHLIETGGVVSLDTVWALDQGLRPSHQSPTDSNQSIYQVDVFHALHCLVSDFINFSKFILTRQVEFSS